MPRKQAFDFQFTDSSAASAMTGQKSGQTNSWGTIWNKLDQIILAVVALYERVWKNEKRANNLRTDSK